MRSMETKCLVLLTCAVMTGCNHHVETYTTTNHQRLSDAFWPPAPGAAYHPRRAKQNQPRYWPPEEHIGPVHDDTNFFLNAKHIK